MLWWCSPKKTRNELIYTEHRSSMATAEPWSPSPRTFPHLCALSVPAARGRSRARDDPTRRITTCRCWCPGGWHGGFLCGIENWELIRKKWGLTWINHKENTFWDFGRLQLLGVVSVVFLLFSNESIGICVRQQDLPPRHPPALQVGCAAWEHWGMLHGFLYPLVN